MIENHVCAEATGVFAGMEKAVDHRQSIAQHIGQRASDEHCRACRRLSAWRIFDDMRVRPAFPRPSPHSRTAPYPTCRRRNGVNRDKRAAERIARASPPRELRCARDRRCAGDTFLIARQLEAVGHRCAPKRRPNRHRRPADRRWSGCGESPNGSEPRSSGWARLPVSRANTLRSRPARQIGTRPAGRQEKLRYARCSVGCHLPSALSCPAGIMTKMTANGQPT